MSNNITALSYAVSALVCALTAIGLRRSYQKDETWLPSFVASTTFKAFVFWVFCVFVPLWVRSYQNGDNIVVFGMFLLFPAILLLTSLASMFTYLIFKFVPKARRTPISSGSKTRAVLFANIALLCVGFLIVGVVAITG